MAWVIWLFISIGLMFLVLLLLDWLDEDEFIAEHKRIEKEEEYI